MVPRQTLKQSGAIFAACTGLFFCLVALLLFSTNMQRGLSHDEHMYVAAGALLAKGQLPYLNFPYLQMPNLAFIYAALFGLSDYLLLTARTFSTVAALGSLAMVYWAISDTLRDARFAARFIFGAGSVLLIINSPIFGYTSGQAWNHDASVLFCLGAFALHCMNIRQEGAARLTLLCGLLVGLAIGTRLLFVFVVPVFAVAIAVLPPRPPARRNMRLLAWFAWGMLLGLLPSLALFVISPGGFLFGNFAYHQANAEFWHRIGYTRAMDALGKLGYLWDVIVEPGNLTLVLGTLALGLGVVLTRAYRSFSNTRELYLAVALLVALLIGAFVPDPTWYQYYYAPLPFLVLCAGYCASVLYQRIPNVSLGLYVALALLSFVYRQPFYPVENILAPETWATVKVHRVGEELKRYLGSSRVLTFAPIYPLEGGVGIYNNFADGPFAWRSISLLSQRERTAAGLMSLVELDTLLKREPPKAILLGFEVDLERSWLEFAQKNGYKEIALEEGATLWLSP